jgi:hypothetical protein
MSADIREKIEACQTCQTYQDKQQKETMMSYPIPSRPWEIVSQDLLTYRKKNYLITVDHYSDMWLLDELETTTSDTIIECTKKHFALHGICATLISDNGPQWVSRNFAEFTKNWEFDHITSSPYHSQSNGKAESAVKIAKKLIKKTTKEESDLYLAILDWRNTPDEAGYSPAQKLMSRRTRTLLPITEILLKPKVVTGVTENIKSRKQKAKKTYDKSAKDLPELSIGELVRVQPHHNDPKQEWEIAECKAKVGPRSYIVETEDGRLYRRNRKFLSTTG